MMKCYNILGVLYRKVFKDLRRLECYNGLIT